MSLVYEHIGFDIGANKTWFLQQNPIKFIEFRNTTWDVSDVEIRLSNSRHIFEPTPYTRIRVDPPSNFFKLVNKSSSGTASGELIISSANYDVLTNPQKPPASISTSQVSVSTTATKLADIETGEEDDSSLERFSVTFRNTHATSVLFLGGSAVTTGTGFRVKPDESFTLSNSGEIWGIADSGTITVDVLKEFYKGALAATRKRVIML